MLIHISLKTASYHGKTYPLLVSAILFTGFKIWGTTRALHAQFRPYPISPSNTSIKELPASSLDTIRLTISQKDITRYDYPPLCKTVIFKLQSHKINLMACNQHIVFLMKNNRQENRVCGSISFVKVFVLLYVYEYSISYILMFLVLVFLTGGFSYCESGKNY